MGYFQCLKRLLVAFSFVISVLDIKSLASPPNLQAVNYLQRYGYIDSTSSNLVSLEAAIKDFQRFAGLPETGNMDEATLNMMQKPRCAVKDHFEHARSIRKKRYALQGSRWHMNVLSYRISKYPRGLPTALADNIIATAFQAWSNVTNLNFILEERENEEPHINLRFEPDDEFLNDGSGKNLAFAYSPKCGGDVIFNDQMEWTINEYRGNNLFQAALHEIGHSLGLVHSAERRSVMAPFYLGYDPETRLHIDDIEGIQSLYGRPHRTPPVTRQNHHRRNPDPNGPNLCEDPSIDAATIVDDGRTFVFKGNHYWEIEETGTILNGPRKIFDDWDGMPGNVDAALTWTDGKTYIFKNRLVYRFNNQEMDYGYPKSINSEFPGIPNNLDAAFVYSGNGRIYFFKGDMYWRYESCQNPRVITSFYPHNINNWNDLPTHMDAALTWHNQKTYFFKGREYYKYDDKTNSVEEHRSTSEYWLDCNE